MVRKLALSKARWSLRLQPKQASRVFLAKYSQGADSKSSVFVIQFGAAYLIRGFEPGQIIFSTRELVNSNGRKYGRKTCLQVSLFSSLGEGGPIFSRKRLDGGGAG